MDFACQNVGTLAKKHIPREDPDNKHDPLSDEWRGWWSFEIVVLVQFSEGEREPRSEKSWQNTPLNQRRIKASWCGLFPLELDYGDRLIFLGLWCGTWWLMTWNVPGPARLLELSLEGLGGLLLESSLAYLPAWMAGLPVSCHCR